MNAIGQLLFSNASIFMSQVLKSSKHVKELCKSMYFITIVEIKI